MHPAMYEGPRMVKPPIVQIAGMLRARRAGVTTDAWTWIADNAGQRLFDPPNVAGWDEARWLDTARLSGRWTAAAQTTEAAAVDEDTTTRRRPPARRSPRRCGSGATRRCRGRRTRSCSAFANRGRSRRQGGLAEGHLPGAAPERAADPDRRRARTFRPHEPRARHRIAAAASTPGRSSPGAPLAEAGKGLPAIEAGMPAPAGTGLSRRSFLLRSGGLAMSVYGASLLDPRAFADGIAKAAASNGRVLVSRSSSRAGSTRSRSSRRSTTTAIGSCDRP